MMVTTGLFHPAGVGKSDPGRVRVRNEDAMICDDELGVYAVIDGVGGQAAGDQAAAIAREMLLRRLSRLTGSIAERLREAITIANNEIHRQARQQPDWRGMACVLTVAVIAGGWLTIGHVGDSRLYLLYEGKIEKLTSDHSPVGAREDEGSLAEIEAMRHPRRNEIDREVGGELRAPEDEAFIEIIEAPLPSDCALLLCTDGLSDLVTRDRIARIEARHRDDPQRVVDELIRAANEAGGRDNITVVYVTGAGRG
jgi:serine/threonine protein phosphatase PrpC